MSNDVKPGAGEDAYRVPVIVAAGLGIAVVQVGGLEVGSAAVAGEVAVRCGVVCLPPNRSPTWVTCPDRWSGQSAGQANQQFGLGVGI